MSDNEVKPLVWDEFNSACTAFGSYRVEEHGPAIYAVFENRKTGFPHSPDVSTAKFVAEADYDRRVKSCIINPSPVVGTMYELDHAQTAKDAFTRWCTQGPQLAKAAGCYVAIRVSDLADERPSQPQPTDAGEDR